MDARDSNTPGVEEQRHNNDVHRESATSTPLFQREETQFSPDNDAQPVPLAPPPVDLERFTLHPPGAKRLTVDAALEIIAQANSTRDQHTALLCRLYEGGAHLVLGFSNFGVFCEERLGIDARAGYRHVKIGQFRRTLSVNFDTDTSDVSDSAMAKLGSLKHDPARMVEALDDAFEEARRRGRDAPTADDIDRATKSRVDAPVPIPSTSREEKRVGELFEEIADLQSCVIGDAEAEQVIEHVDKAQSILNGSRSSASDLRYAVGVLLRLLKKEVERRETAGRDAVVAPSFHGGTYDGR